MPDVFISYSRADNNFDWVTLLRENIVKLLAFAKDEIDVFLDTRDIAGNDPLDDTLTEKVKRSTILLIVMSQNYCDSEYCRHERDWFIEGAGGLEKARRRIFVVRVSDFEPRNWPKDLRQNIAKNFFEKDPATGTVQEISFDFEKAGRPPLVCAELAGEIGQALRDVSKLDTDDQEVGHGPSDDEDNGTRQQTNGPTLFLTEVADDLYTEYARLAKYLNDAGIRVVAEPKRQFRWDPDTGREVVPQLLQEATLVVHLHSVTPIPSDEVFRGGFERWVLEQTKKAGFKSGESWFRWRRFGLNPDQVVDSKQRELVFQDDVIAEDMARFRQNLVEHAFELERRKALAQGGDGLKVLVATKREARDLADELSETIERFHGKADRQSLEVEILHEETDLRTVVDEFQRRSLATAGFFVVYCDTDEVWVNGRMRECRRVALGSRPPVPVCVVYVNPPDEQPRPSTTPPRFHVIRHAQPDALESVLQKIGEVCS